MIYNWQRLEWPEFTFDLSGIEDKLYQFMEKTGLVTGIFKTLPDEARTEAIIEIMVAEAIKTSEIEGEYLSRKDVMSSIRKAFGLFSPDPVIDKRSKSIGDLMIDVRETYQSPLTKEQLFHWHQQLFATDRVILKGAWRDHPEPMQVISGAMGKEIVHFEAPPSERVANEMDQFIKWFNDTAPGGSKEIKKTPVRCAVAHLYFETIHPFEDGNGRIGRVIAEKALSQGMGRPALLSLSRTIEGNRKGYYDALQKAQSSPDITPWIHYFTGVILEAQEFAEEQIDFTINKTRFFDRFKRELNERQLKLIQRIFEEGPKGFKGGINTSKYVSITKSPNITASRDLKDLLAKGIIMPFDNAGGRSTKYKLNLDFVQFNENAVGSSLADQLRAAVKESHPSIRKNDDPSLPIDKGIKRQGS
ncbi:Fic family protein [Mucilaginibacter sp. FT3.2]|uniref:Fic family protein n=1 Tax=Mucilaginibacter sp. FT3.2 TaxID=2723090 RepID=UPI0016188BEB|nr:Fic family protein [Mucilaginibacter sp. FT3.2]MBB6234283.1 Fic family protein [Mucilaginibacter sp. FT3.2]